MADLPKSKKLVLFDGICNLCNSSIQYIIKHDKKEVFMFATLQGDKGQEIVKQFNIDTNKVDSIILYTNDKGIKTKSSAGLAIVSKLGFPTNLATVFYIIPVFIRNFFYDYIAKNRYKWYGKKESCMIPTPELQERFLN